MSEWFSVKDRLPTPGRLVLVACSDRLVNVGVKCSNGKWEIEGRTGYPLDAVTHWMPLPAPPEVK